MRNSIVTGALTALAIAGAMPAMAQDNSPERQAAYQRMYANPGDVDAMLAYAALAVQDRAFEDAASTLERVLDIDPANLGARLDLAIAYYALGSYGQAGYHFGIVSTSGAATPAQQDLITQYQTDVEQGQSRSQFSGYGELGAAYSEDSDETGLTFGAGLTHRYDLGGPVDNAWITQFRVEILDFGDTFGTPEQTTFLLRTGPAFAFGGEAFSPRLRPYIEVAREDTPFGPYSETIGLGLQYSNPISADIAVFAALEGGWIDREFVGDDGQYVEALMGLTWRPQDATRIRFTVRAIDEIYDSAFDETDLIGARVDLRHEFDPGFIDVDRNWAVTAHAQYDQEHFPGPDLTDDLLSYGLGLRAFVTDDIYVQGQVDYYQRQFDGGGQTDDTLVRLVVGMEF